MIVEKSSARPRIDDLIYSISLHIPNPVLFNFNIFPFIALYFSWAYCWFFVYNEEEHYEAGLVILAVIGAVQILTCLSCFWNVSIRAFFTCRKVRKFI